MGRAADTDANAGYGLWPLVIVNTALFAVFAASFFHPRTGRDWRVMGAFTAFLVIGWGGDPHLSPFHLASYVFIGGGFWLIVAAWRILHDAARTGQLATSGPYARVRHPQYDGFLLIMIGFLVQWPTVPTLLMFPILVVIYTRLARAEEREVAERFGGAWRTYAATTPGFLPRPRRSTPPPTTAEAAVRPATGHGARGRLRVGIRCRVVRSGVGGG